jgi:hypothetical protein
MYIFVEWILKIHLFYGLLMKNQCSCVLRVFGFRSFNLSISILGYRLSPQTLSAIAKRYSKNGRIFFDDYVACCVKLRALTGIDHFRVGLMLCSYFS